MTDAKQIVRDFCGAWERLDTQAILDAFTEDAEPDAQLIQQPVELRARGGRRAARAPQQPQQQRDHRQRSD